MNDGVWKYYEFFVLFLMHYNNNYNFHQVMQMVIL